MKIYPIAITVPHWNSYITNANELLNHSITNTVDRYNLGRGLDAFIISLCEFKRNEVLDPEKSLRESGSLLKHISVTFIAETYHTEIIRDNGLNVTSVNNSVAIISGTLYDWRNALSDLSMEKNLREFTNKCYEYFELAGLGQLWSKINGNDGFFKLEKK